jgi:hypothetical protein
LSRGAMVWKEGQNMSRCRTEVGIVEWRAAGRSKACDCNTRKGDASSLWLHCPTAAASASVSLGAAARVLWHSMRFHAHDARQTLVLPVGDWHLHRGLRDSIYNAVHLSHASRLRETMKLQSPVGRLVARGLFSVRHGLPEPGEPGAVRDLTPESPSSRAGLHQFGVESMP